MTEFLAALALYYSCDATAMVRQMGAVEQALCTARYEAVTEYFADPDDPAVTIRQARFDGQPGGFRDLHDWEAGHPERAAAMRADAAAEVRRRIADAAGLRDW